MKKLKKNELYDKICRTLTDYENCETNEDHPKATKEDLYYLLVEIQNNWEDLV